MVGQKSVWMFRIVHFCLDIKQNNSVENVLLLTKQRDVSSVCTIALWRSTALIRLGSSGHVRRWLE
jgi:hypothetical protein